MIPNKRIDVKINFIVAFFVLLIYCFQQTFADGFILLYLVAVGKGCLAQDATLLIL